MNNLESSLCASCDHLVYCSLTSDKGFIWSCSEYEVTNDHDEAFRERIMKENDDFSVSISKLVLK